MPPLTLLAVTADPLLLRLLSTRYTAPDYLLIAEGDARQAGDGLRSFAPDLIVVDGNDAAAEALRRHAVERGLALLALLPAGLPPRPGTPQLTKPFATSALFAQIESLLPESANRNAILASGPLRLNRLTRRVSVGGTDIPLHARTFGLLAALMRHVDRVFTREQLLDDVWGDDACLSERTVDVFVGRLRQALAPHGLAACIETVRGAGYRFSPPPAATENLRLRRPSEKAAHPCAVVAHA